MKDNLLEESVYQVCWIKIIYKREIKNLQFNTERQSQE